jgi:hypothetical protein
MYDNVMLFVFGMMTGGVIVLCVAMVTALVRVAGMGGRRR